MGCGGSSDGPDGTGERREVTVLAAGDIGACDSEGDEATGRLAESIPEAPILALGDIAYPNGAAADFARCYEPSWGKVDDRVRPTPGNHEYLSRAAAPYFARFGGRAGPGRRGYYSFDLGGWHIVSLNSNCEFVRGICDENSEQVRWLRADLARSRARCTLAFMHHPIRSSGEHGDYAILEPLREALVDAHADVLLAGHDHDYERYAPRDGVTEWVVGTGGGELRKVVDVDRGSKAHSDTTHGLLELKLREGSYRWRFLAAGGGGFRDAGQGRCA